MELHIFDFDGCVFHSPTPRKVDVVAQFDEETFNRLGNPCESKGLGWFQSLSTLTPPAVPEQPDTAQWYVAPTLHRIHALSDAALATAGSGHHASPPSQRVNTAAAQADGAAAVGRSRPPAHLFVLTGRDEKYRSRITALIANAGLAPLMSGIYLKPTETAGTVKFKLKTIFSLIRQYRPRKVFYYDDRLSQGATIFAGIRELQIAMYPRRQTSSSIAVMPAVPSAPGEEQPISYSELFKDAGEEARATARATRWVADTVNYFNEISAQRSATRGNSSQLAKTAAPTPHDSRARDGGGDAVPAVTFKPPPLFDFSLLVVHPSLAEHSEKLLSADAQRELVERLLAEYDDTASRTSSAAGPHSSGRHPSAPSGNDAWRAYNAENYPTLPLA